MTCSKTSNRILLKLRNVIEMSLDSFNFTNVITCKLTLTSTLQNPFNDWNKNGFPADKLVANNEKKIRGTNINKIASKARFVLGFVSKYRMLRPDTADDSKSYRGLKPFPNPLSRVLEKISRKLTCRYSTNKSW